MSSRTIALLHPGDMGGAVGASLVSAGHRVLWCSDGRSASTRARAEAAGLTDVKHLAMAVEQADIVLSICPPHGAVDLAKEVAGLGFRGTFVDANAIATATTKAIGRIVTDAGAEFVDGGIIGPPPVKAGTTWLFLAGDRAAEVAALFKGSLTQAVDMQRPVGAASALKVCYAAWNKGSIALLGAIRALARHEGVEDALLAQWAIGVPDIPKRSEAISANARKAWRWSPEMEEIAANFEAAGLPGGFHHAAAEVYARLEGFKDAGAPPTMDAITAALPRKSR